MPKEHPEPTPATVKELYANAYRCGRPGCSQPLYVVEEGTGKRTLNSRVAHICACSEGGPRWDATMSADENRAVGNRPPSATWWSPTSSDPAANAPGRSGVTLTVAVRGGGLVPCEACLATGTAHRRYDFVKWTAAEGPVFSWFKVLAHGRTPGIGDSYQHFWIARTNEDDAVTAVVAAMEVQGDQLVEVESCEAVPDPVPAGPDVSATGRAYFES